MSTPTTNGTGVPPRRVVVRRVSAVPTTPTPDGLTRLPRRWVGALLTAAVVVAAAGIVIVRAAEPDAGASLSPLQHAARTAVTERLPRAQISTVGVISMRDDQARALVVGTRTSARSDPFAASVTLRRAGDTWTGGRVRVDPAFDSAAPSGLGSDQEAAAQAAQVRLAAMLTFSHDDLEGDLSVASGNTVGGFRSTYTQRLSELIASSWDERRASMRSTVDAVAVTGRQGRDIGVVAVINARLAVENGSSTTQRFLVRATLRHLGDQWLVADLTSA